MGNYSECWLDYNKAPKLSARHISISAPMGSRIVENAISELQRAFASFTDGAAEISLNRPAESAELCIALTTSKACGEGGYTVKAYDNTVEIGAEDDEGLLHGVFYCIRKYQLGEKIEATTHRQSNPLRMLNHWDNPDGTIERGYSGGSFFLGNGDIITDERVEFYARLVASVGINAVCINNVNVRAEATAFITERYYDRLSRLTEIFGGYGIRLFICLNFAAPIELGGLTSADPLDESVIGWWKSCLEKLYTAVPRLGGFLVKADSEGRPGPFTYGRTHAEGANMPAAVIAAYGGLIIWRCFVYNCRQDWRDRKTDRARAAYDNFIGLDGKFADNVILQVKNGPMDFQVREPVSPLFGGLKKTNTMLELQLAQEYTGQQIDLCYLIPWYKQVLDFKTYCGENDRVSDIVSGRCFSQTACGIAGVANTGDAFNWTGHDLAAANLFGFGLMCGDTSLPADRLAEAWVKMTFGCDKDVSDTVTELLMMSWRVYEEYNAPLGVGWMCNPNNHYGANVDGYEYDRWGTYHFADCFGIGVDRTVAGTGYCTQYNEPNASLYGNPESCPDELLLFFHHLPYTHILHSGETIIQHIYNTHFDGVEHVKQMLSMWRSLDGKIDGDVFTRVSERFARQLDNAVEWRDRVNTYFLRKSGIPDERGRKIY